MWSALVEEKTGMTLSDSQRDALRLALVSKMVVITGVPVSAFRLQEKFT
jgi:hypothetical protein